MTDPLRPFADMIRALWLARTQGKSAARAQNAAPVRTDSPRPGRARSFRSQLRARVAASSNAGPARMREVFVETILLWELGEQLAPDPDFAGMVTTVSEQVASDPALAERLNHVLRELAAEARPPR
jgi:hypothetical protein